MTFYFSLSALIITLVFVYNFFAKEKIRNVEIYLYKWILLLTIWGLCTEVVTSFLVLFAPGKFNLVLKWGYKFLNIFYISWFLLFTLYTKYISLPKKKRYKSLRQKNVPLYVLALVFFSLIILFTKNIERSFIYLICFMYTMYSLYLSIKFSRNIESRKLAPLYFLCVLLIVCFLINSFFPNIVLLSYFISLVVIMMYFSIENPDVKLIKQLNVALDRAEKADAAKTEFLSNMSHEIRTPLNAVVGFSNLLNDNDNIPDTAKEDVKDLLNASDELLHIVEGILDITKLSLGNAEIVNRNYVVDDFVNELSADVRKQLEFLPIDFRVNIDPAIPKVLYGDVGKIKRICENILNNAVKFTKEGWIEFRINVVKKKDLCRLIITIEDTGMGIKKEDLGKIFNKFEKTSQTMNFSGTGLGLSIAKAIVDALDGKITVQSIYGKGTKFVVTLIQKDGTKNGVKSPVQPLALKNVLIVDDNAINLQVASKLVKAYGVNVKTCFSGEDALKLLKQTSDYDLIFLDIMMPNMDGVELLKRIRKEYDYKNYPIVALTADALTGMREKYLALGFDEFLAKPIDKNELNEIINKYLNNN